MARPVQPAFNHALAVAAGGTFLLELLPLAIVGRVFTGGWLGDHVLTSLPDRLTLLGILALYALGVAGLVLGLGVVLMRLFRIRGERAVWITGLGWLVLLAGVTALKLKIGAHVRDALDLDLVRRLGGGTIFGAVEYTLTWFWKETLIGIAAFVVAIWGCRRLYRRLRTTDFETRPLGRLRARWVWTSVIVALLFLLLDVTVLGRHWPAVSWASRQSFIGSTTRAVVSRASDLDGDGVGAFDSPPDHAPYDASRHPYAPDAPDDGTDANGLLGDLRLSEVPAAPRAAADRRRSYPPLTVRQRRNVILVFLESFRGDLIGTEENGVPLTPVLSEMIEDGEALNVEQAWACVALTAPAITQAFWGAYVRRGPTLLHDLRDNGYYCAGASGQLESWDDIDVDTGLVDCDFYEDPRHDDQDHVVGGVRPLSRVLGSIDRFLEARPRDRPFFLYVNLQDCHFPYNLDNEPLVYRNLPREPSLGRGNADVLRKHYINEAAAVDRGIGAIRDRLKAVKAWDDTILVLVSDHGESIYHDDVLGHGLRLTDVQTRLAFVIVHPTTDVVAPLAHVDIRGLVRGMLETERPSAVPAVRQEPGGRVLQVIGSLDHPRRLAHVAGIGSRVIYDLGRGLCIDQAAGRTCPLDSSRPEDAPLLERIRGLIRHWEYERWLMTGPGG